MSAFVLNRNYELQLPNSFVDVDRDDMEYVDGGWAYTKRFTDKGCLDSMLKAAVGYGAMAIIAAFGAVITGATGIGLVAFTLIGGYNGYLSWKCFDSYNNASYYYQRDGAYWVTISGVGPLVTGVSVHAD